MKILKKYNVVSREFEKKFPTNPADETRQSIEDNERIIELCQI